ncbi:MAG: sigma-70 family RNA polymerase sigma factor [Lachnospiraceae bacterium]|nr:sigma-70 family RNA polymerase sigma factor [Lachnospiraceae bacterium]
MTRDPLVQQFFDRSEEAIAEAKRRYGSGLCALALRILGSAEDAEEVENDVYREAWDAIPPAEPDSLKSWLYMVCRRRALDRLDERLAAKRGGGEAAAVLDELEDILPGEDGRDWAENLSRREALNRFLKELPARERSIFLKRYWYFLSVREIARQERLTDNHVKVLLFRIRHQLKELLQKEGLWYE